MSARTRPFGDTIPLARALEIVRGTVQPIARMEWITIDEANGRVLAQDVAAPMDVPPFARAAMDGYAVRASDIAGATREDPLVLTCVEQVLTGRMPARPVGPGQCTEIATGAPMPAGADAVVMVEHTDGAAAGGPVQVFAPVQTGQNVGRRGADIQVGQPVLRAGDTLNASRVGALAAVGYSSVQVYAKPRVAVLSTGEEIVEPGHPLAPGQLYDVNRFTVSAVVADHGGIAVHNHIAADTLPALLHAVDQAATADIIVFSGGSSVGVRDLVVDVLAAKGEVLFHGISIKPGKPTAFGTVGGRPFFGLPGYPTSCLINAHLLVVPALRAMARLTPQALRSVQVPLAQRITSVRDRHQFYTVRVAGGRAVPAFKASGDITSMSQADGYIEIAAGTESVDEGQTVEVTLF